jgi:hypothetical protein
MLPTYVVRLKNILLYFEKNPFSLLPRCNAGIVIVNSEVVGFGQTQLIHHEIGT